MADPVDIAQDHIERQAPYLLAASKRPAGPAPTGRCHYCDETVADGMRFCDAECRDEYDKHQRAVARAGSRDGWDG